MGRLLGTLGLLAALCPSPASAAITSTGDVTPAGPSAWTGFTEAYVGFDSAGALDVNSGSGLASEGGYLGYNATAEGTVTVDGPGSVWTGNGGIYAGYFGTGTLNVTNGGAVSSSIGFLGYNSGASGTVAVDGSGSTWSDAGGLFVGNYGAGTLKITNGGAVSVQGETRLGPGATSLGAIDFGANGGSLTTALLYASPSQLTGMGTIITGGLVSDVDLVFDAAHGLKQTLTLASLPGQNVTIQFDMSNPANGPTVGAGWIGTGSLTIRNGIAVSTSSGYLGYNRGSAGTATVDGANSTWTNADLFVGFSGTGTLKVTNGGTVSNGTGYLGNSVGSSGTATVDGSGSVWNNSGALYVGVSGIGTLKVTNGGAVNAPEAQLGCFGSSGIATVDGSGSTWTGADLFVGYSGTGTLKVTNGGTVTNAYDAYLGGNLGSSGTASIDGPGSTWTNGGRFYIGSSGSGTLSITNGGTVASSYAFLGGYGSRYRGTGAATVNGAHSVWNNSADLYVGSYGTGTLNVANGGAVFAGGTTYVGGGSLLAIDVGRGSSLTVGGGTGTISNAGTVRLLAGAGVPAGNTYSPISAGIWSGGGTYQAVGGTWNSANYQFTVSATQAGTPGTPVAIDLSQEQRVLVTGAGAGAELGASFLAATSPTPITFTGSLVGGSLLTSLTSLLGPGDSVMSGWTCSTTGYASGSRAYLSLAGAGNGGGFYPGGLDVWNYVGGWSPFSADDLTYDGTFASFTVTSFGSFAVTGVAVMPGDANRDGQVDINDLTIVLTNFGRTGRAWSQGCMDGDPTGKVDINDLTIVLANFGTTYGASCGVNAVPEPSCVILLGIGAVGLLACAWRRRA